MKTGNVTANETRFDNLIRLTACNTISSLQQQLVGLVGALTGYPVRLYQGKNNGGSLQLLALQECPASSHVIIEVSRTLVDRYQDDSVLLSTLKNITHDVRHKKQGGQIIFYMQKNHDLQLYLVCDGKVKKSEQEQISAMLMIYANMLNQLQFSLTDALTGLLNRKAYEERMIGLYHNSLSNQLKRRKNDGRHAPISGLAFIDIDHFKKINDEHGHGYGDEVLVWVAQLMRQFFRQGDLIFRYGGEEFVVLLMGSDLETSRKILERFRAEIARQRMPGLDQLTVSIGYAELDFNTTYQDVTRRADAAMYYSKQRGRNAVNCYETLLAARKIKPLTKGQADNALPLERA